MSTDDWCAKCLEWYLIQRVEKPNFSKRGHLDRCPCECHPENKGIPKQQGADEGKNVA